MVLDYNKDLNLSRILLNKIVIVFYFISGFNLTDEESGFISSVSSEFR